MPPPNYTPARIGAVVDGYRYLASGTWQRVTPPDAAPVPPATTGTEEGCPSGMVRVRGQALRGVTTAMQDAHCTRWLPGEPRRCATYNESGLQRAYARLSRVPMDFCMDRYEFPNVAGEYPAVGMSYRQAIAMCAERGARVCNDREFTFSCSGEEGRPYATGFTRPVNECAIDRRWRNPSAFRRQRASSEQGGRELALIFQADRSGSHPACVSPFGVYDQAGNADENVADASNRGPYANLMMGGHWAGVRNRCVPATTAHNEGYRDYQLSFRCCADAPVPPPPVSPHSLGRNLATFPR